MFYLLYNLSEGNQKTLYIFSAAPNKNGTILAIAKTVPRRRLYGIE